MSDVIIERLTLLSNYYCTTPPPFNFFRRLTSSSAARHRRPLSSHHPPPTTCARHIVHRPCLPLVHCLCLLPPTLVASSTSAIPSFPRRPLSSAAHSPLAVLSARSRLSALAGCRITTSCDAAAYHPSALLPLVCRFPSSTRTLHHFHASLSNNAGVHRAGTLIFQIFQFRLTQKWYQCLPHRANCAKPRCALVADSVSRLIVRGREHSTTGSGRMMVRSGRGPISYPIGQPSGS